MLAQETLDNHQTYVLKVVLKTANKYLIDGKIWVDATDCSIIRIEGKLARNPSFWVRSVHFEHTYQKVGKFWFAQSTRTEQTADRPELFREHQPAKRCVEK